MAICANTLFHITNKSSLESILKEFFCLKYSKESLLGVVSNNSDFIETYIPMVCFCDIPMSQLKDHMKFYGYYGIGLTKQWGLKNKISPVLYMPNDSQSQLYIKSISNELQRFEDDKSNNSNVIAETIVRLKNLYKFIKPYSGQAVNRLTGEYYEDRIFYFEREWRFSPDDFNIYPVATGVDTEKEKQLNKKRLCFTPDDVKYIIVAHETEISEFIKIIEGLCHTNSKLLIPKLISYNQIMEDM